MSTKQRLGLSVFEEGNGGNGGDGEEILNYGGTK
jgi:hypothetical protein